MRPARFEIVGGQPPVLRVRGDVDEAIVEEFTGALREAAADGQVVIDAAELTFIDSSGLRCLVVVASEGNRPVVRRAPPLLRRLVELVELGATIELHDD